MHWIQGHEGSLRVGRCSTRSDALRAVRLAVPRGYSLSSWRKIVAEPWLVDGIKGVGAR